MSNASAPVPVGTLVADKYRIDRVLGAGGMGVVVAATHVQLERAVALKFLLNEAAASPDVVSRFTREAKAASKIHSEHVARVLDVGALDTGEPYLVMEYLDGEDLARVLARRGPLPPAEAIDWTLQACEAIAEAHALGIVHRDLKPANLFLASHPSGKPVVKVLDFGISKAPPSATEAALTTTSSVVGSPLYMSPEQMTSARDVDARSDIWSLGVVLYELLTGAHPFPADTLPALVLAVARAKPRPLRAVREELSPGLEDAVLRCLAKEPEGRYATIALFAAAIAAFGSPRAAEAAERIEHVLLQPPVRTGPNEVADEYAPTVPARTPSNWTPPGPRASHPKRAPRVLSAVALVVLLAGGAVALLIPSRREAEAIRSASTAEPLAPPVPIAPAPTVSVASSLAPPEPPAPSASTAASASATPKPAMRATPPSEPRPAIPRMDLK